MSRARTAVLLAALLLAGCGGGDEPGSSVPEGFKELAGPNYRFAHPGDWTPITATNTRGAQGPKATGGLAPQAAVAAGPSPGVTLDIAVDGFKADNLTRRGNWKVVREEPFKLEGAKEARLIEARFDAVTGDVTTPVRSIDVLARSEDGMQQYDLILRAPEADFERLRLPEVLDTFRLG